jgi:very-short-patch-repair endonuclease
VKGRTNQEILRPKLQRRLRSDMTLAEQRLWRHLRRKQMADFKFRRQHPFGDYILDFVCLEAMLAIEVDGGQHNGRQSQDAVRTEYLQHSGFRVLRFWNNEVMSDIEAVTSVIWRALHDTNPTPIPAFCSASSVPLPLKGKEVL